MELKTLILGLFMSMAAFAVKSGGGLAYLLLQTPGKTRKAATTLAFMAVYGLVFTLAAFFLQKVNLSAHVDLLQGFFKSGMTLHFLLALLLVIWGIRLLLKNNDQKQGSTRGWIPLVIPCPVCFTVILLSCSFVGVLYPDSPLVFMGLYSGFILISLLVATGFAFVIKNKERAEPFLGILMLYIAGYFMLSVIVVPQFADLDKIYRISVSDPFFDLSKEKIFLLALCLAALAAGLVPGLRNPKKRE